MVAPSITQSDILTVLRSVLLSIVPPGVGVIAGQQNRTAEPQESDFIVMTPIFRERLETDLVVWADCALTGSCSGATLTVTSVAFGTIANGAPLFWPVAPYSGLTIAYGGTGTGGTGTYMLSGPLSLGGGPLAAGQLIVTQPTEFTIQLDFHSANILDASDMAASVTTLFRSEIATTASMFNSATTGVWPLYADEGRQVPFLNGEQQYESMWTVDAHLQVNQAVSWPQQFFTNPVVDLYEADVLHRTNNLAPRLDFSKARNSQYLGLLIR